MGCGSGLMMFVASDCLVLVHIIYCVQAFMGWWNGVEVFDHIYRNPFAFCYYYSWELFVCAMGWESGFMVFGASDCLSETIYIRDPRTRCNMWRMEEFLVCTQKKEKKKPCGLTIQSGAFLLKPHAILKTIPKDEWGTRGVSCWILNLWVCSHLHVVINCIY